MKLKLTYFALPFVLFFFYVSLNFLAYQNLFFICVSFLIPAVQIYARTFDPNKHYLWPIPQTAIDQSPGLTQNPGY